MLANNISNASTGGYKRDSELYGLYAAEQNAADPEVAVLPVIERHWTDFAQGQLQPTGNPLDVSLSGKGFFAVDGPAGPLYTRNGSFQLSSNGSLTTMDGYAVRLVGGGALQVEAGAPLEIGRDGSVRQRSQLLGRIEVVDFADRSVLAKQSGVYFRSADPNRQPVPAAGVEVHQGKIEASNVAGAESAVRLVSVMRQFEMLQRAVLLAGEMNRKAIDEVARVGS